MTTRGLISRFHAYLYHDHHSNRLSRRCQGHLWGSPAQPDVPVGGIAVVRRFVAGSYERNRKIKRKREKEIEESKEGSRLLHNQIFPER